ncbi:MAG: AAA family ATPase, partial [Candidatus Eisenbacteria bacterium]|nr:AAA family ATPase [Candidatus Latescibacterota bacterium]MBD3303178.1 AAA family ATPase [Candidatus Eisenbacteria bacterium]
MTRRRIKEDRSMSEPRRTALQAEDLRWICDPAALPFETTEEIECCERIIGQDRAVRAIELGLQVRSKGYNIFVCGEPGTGRTTSVKHLLETTELKRDPPPDVVYVNNFKNPDMPIAILLSAGEGGKLKKEMEELVVHMRTSIQQIYESEQFKERTKQIVERYKEREKEIVRQLEEKIREESFALIQVQLGPFSKPEIAPVVDGEPMQMDRLENLTRQDKFDEKRFATLKEKAVELTALMEETFREARSLKRRLRSELAELEKEFGRPVVDDFIKDMQRSYDNPKIHEYLDEVRDQILSNMDQFKEADGEEQPTAHPPVEDERSLPYQVNVLVDNSGTERPPVMIETSPNYRNLFGTIEKVIDRSGHWKSDFMHIKAGSLLRANGGFLVLNLFDFIQEPGVWSALKRTLKNRQVDIQGNDPLYLLSASALKPEPIPVDVRVVVIGDARSYRILYALDPDFRKIFKVKSDFDSVMPHDEESVTRYTDFIRKVQFEEDLLPVDRTGVAAILERGVRLGGRRTKLSTRFSEIADLLRESSYWAEKDGRNAVSALHVRRALEEKVHRIGLIEAKLQEWIIEGQILVDTDGSAVGQINGLSIWDLGDYLFGRPTRITAKTGIGRAGVINIEREAEMSGRTHNKGMLIIEGFFRELFARSRPLAMSASICFEQSYSG